MNDTDKKVSPYTVLNRWIYDGSKTTTLPQELIDDKVIRTDIILYHFQCSKYIPYISELFNTYDVYQLSKIDVFKFLKQCVRDSGFKPSFFAKIKTEKNKLYKVLKLKFPYLKSYDIELLIDQIDNSVQKDAIYETLGFYTPKKKKSTKSDIDMIKNTPTVEDKENSKVKLDDLMGSFV